MLGREKFHIFLRLYFFSTDGIKLKLAGKILVEKSFALEATMATTHVTTYRPK